MRAMRPALLGAALLCAVASLTGCATSGKPPVVLTKTEVVEAPKRQYVAIPADLLAVSLLPELPTPVTFDSGDCKEGCYSNAQVRDIIDTLVASRGVLVDHLHSIRHLSDDAVAATATPANTKPEGKPP